MRFDANGETVTISVTVSGYPNGGTVEFHNLQEGEDGTSSPRALHLERFDADGVVEVVAPANASGEIYVMVAGKGNGADEFLAGGAPDALKIGTEDVAVSVTAGTEPAWMKEMMSAEPGELEPPPGDPPEADQQ